MSWLDTNGLEAVISKMKTYARSLFKIGSVDHPGMLAPDGTSITVDENGTISSTTTITVDNALSTTSTNPVQNNVITESINDMNDSLDIVKAHAKATGNVHNLTLADLGIANVENKSSAEIRAEITKANVVNALGYEPIQISNAITGLEQVNSVADSDLFIVETNTGTRAVPYSEIRSTGGIDISFNGTGDNSTVLGNNATANGNGSIAIGYNAATWNACNSVALGTNSKITKNDSVAIGYNANTEKNNSVALGSNASVGGNNSIAIGYDARSGWGDNSIAIGYSTFAGKNNNIALGSNIESSGNNGIVIGFNMNDTDFGGDNCIVIGTNCTYSYDSIVLGRNISSWSNSVALGNNVKSTGQSSIAIGSSSRALKSDTVALGSSSNVASNNGVCIGAYSLSGMDNAIALGYSALAYYNSSIALGSNTEVRGNYSTALGYNAQTSNANSIQLGDAVNLSSITAKVAITTTSDERDKADITEIEDSALEFLNKVKAIRYVFNGRKLYIDNDNLSDEEREKLNTYGMCEYDREAHEQGTKKGSRIRVGVSAQNIQQALIEVFGDSGYANLVNDNLFDYNPDEIPEGVESQLAVNYEGFIPFLIKSVQELDSRVKALENK